MGNAAAEATGEIKDRWVGGSERGALDKLAERVERKVEQEPFQRDPSFLRKLLPLMRIWSAYFDGEVRGFEKLPDKGPMLIVGNHSGGVIVPDTSVFISAWYRERGLDDPLVGLAFDAMFAVPGVESLMRKLGEIPARHDSATQALEAGTAVLVYPGGLHEACRPYTDRNRIDLGGHKGFIKLAIRTGVPVVPVVGHGGHETTVVLSRGEKLARYLGLERFRMSAAPIFWQIPWGISPAFLPGIPLPAKITMQVCDPLDWSQLDPDDPRVVDDCYGEITRAMQTVLTRLAEETPNPLLSRFHLRRGRRPRAIWRL